MSFYLMLGLSVTMTIRPGLFEIIPAILPISLGPCGNRITVVGRPGQPTDSIIKNGADLNSNVSADEVQTVTVDEAACCCSVNLIFSCFVCAL